MKVWSTIRVRPLALGQADQLLGLALGGGHRLLDEDVLAGSQGGGGQRPVGADRRGDGHRLDGGVGQQRSGSRASAWPSGQRRTGRGQGGLVLVAQGHDGAGRAGGEVADEVRAPVAAADDGDAKGLPHGRPTAAGSAPPRPTSSESPCPAAVRPWMSLRIKRKSSTGAGEECGRVESVPGHADDQPRCDRGAARPPRTW